MESKKLNPIAWDVRNNLYDPIRKKLIEIAKSFLEELKFSIKIEAIYLTGSLCTYEWSPESDWDLHIIATQQNKSCDEDGFKDYFETKSKLFNKEHNIYIKGYPVEINIKEKEVLLKDKAVYDIIKNKWVSKPVHSEVTLNSSEVLKKTKHLQNIIDNAVENNAPMEKLKKIRDYIKKLRADGLQSDGEFSVGNLTFKRLRHTGYIKKLYDYKAKIRDSKLSMESFFEYYK
jgi:predicted nucleotidyltransferase